MSKEAIISTLDEYAKAYCAKDIKSMMQVFDDTDNISIIGTGADETYVGRSDITALFERNFNDATAKKFDWDWIDVRISNDHAIASVKLTIHLKTSEKSFSVPIRWTVVLKYSNHQWLWIHRNASIASVDQDEGNAYPNN